MTVGRSRQNAFVWIPAQRDATVQSASSAWRAPITPVPQVYLYRAPTYVYVAKSADLVKIGISESPRRRVSDLRGRSALPPSLPKIVEVPSLVYATIGTRKDEKRLHESLRRYRVAGEWYRAECLNAPELAAFLAKPPDFGPQEVRR